MPQRLDKLLLGSNPIVGADHYSSERARERAIQFNAARSLKVIEAAAHSGAQGFTFSPDSETLSLLANMDSIELPAGFGLYPLLPSLGRYWPMLVSGGPGALISEMLKDVGWATKVKATVRGGASLARGDLSGLLKSYLDIEVARIRRVVPKGLPIRGVFLGEFFTDLALSVSGTSLLDQFCGAVRDGFHMIPGLQTLNFARLARAINNSPRVCESAAIMAPFNPIGFQMNPTRSECESSLAHMSGHPVAAISVLAAGRLAIDEAVMYLSKLPSIQSVVVGTSSPSHARESFQAFVQADFPPS